MARRSSRPRNSLVVAIVTAVVALSACDPPPLPPPDTGSGLVPCSSAGQRVELTVSSHLDPSCVYTAGFDITASNVTLDCQGATIRSAPGAGGTGILVHTPVGVELDDVTVRHCRVEGFLNSLRVTRDGFRTLPDNEEFEHPTSDIVIEDSRFSSSRGVGVYVDGYVSDVTIRRNQVTGAGSSGIYLETGSKENTVESNIVANNGYRENGAGGTAFTYQGSVIWFWGVGREGISVDGSYDNTIVGNGFIGNSAGGIFLYKNCGEYPDRNPDRYFERRDPADRNLIERNLFIGGRNGVWVGSRMGENTWPMECSDPAYIEDSLFRVVLDHADDNIIRRNEFQNVTYGVRVEDDGTLVEGNTFKGDTADRHAVIVGTPHRTDVLGLPVARTVLRNNVSTIAGNTHPYRWVHGHAGTVVEGNTALGQPVGVCEGDVVPRQIMVMVIAIRAANPDGSKPPTPDLTVQTVGALPPCS